MAISTPDAPPVEVEVEVEADADAVGELVAEVLSVRPLEVIVEVRVAMLMVAFLDIGTPVPMLAGTIGTVVDAVPLVETVLLAYVLGVAADASAPSTTKGPK